MSKDINGALLDGVLSKVRADIGRYPRRTVRNLLDLGEKLARGQSQKTFLGNARNMLEKRSSAYYKAVEDMVSHVDLDHLFTFGKNVGYNSCLKGSRIIGEIRDKEGYSAPWALSLIMDEDRLSRTPEIYDQVIVQGMGIGIYTYLLFGPETKDLLLLSRTHPECAFVLFVRDRSWMRLFYPSWPCAGMCFLQWRMTGIWMTIAGSCGKINCFTGFIHRMMMWVKSTF